MKRATPRPLSFVAALAAACHSAPPARKNEQTLVVPVRQASHVGLPIPDPATGLDAAIERGSPAAPDAAQGGSVSPALEPEPRGVDTLDPRYAEATPLSGKSIGHTSVAFKLKLEGGLEAAYKPSSRRGPLRYKGEVAAYRLATALGLTNVPPALVRRLQVSSLSTALGGPGSPAGALLVHESLPDASGAVSGALIPWIPRLSFVALEAEPMLHEWTAWLSGKAPIPDDKRALATEISDLIVFDTLTGNWDRWSGGNVGSDGPSGRLLFIDNDAAFYEAPPEGPMAAQWRRLSRVSRFSRSLVARLRRLDAEALRRAIGDETHDVPLLTPRALAGVMARRDEILKAVDARVTELGEAAALAFE